MPNTTAWLAFTRQPYTGLEKRRWTTCNWSTLFGHITLIAGTIFYWIEQKWIIKTKGGLHFCKGCWLRLSGFHYWMFKLRCLVFPFHWLEGQAGLCLGPSHLPSHFPVKGVVVLCAAYLRSRYGISCPFYFDHAGMEAKMRAGPVTTHWQLCLRQASLLDVYAWGSVENTAWFQWISVHFSPVLFSRKSTIRLHFILGSLPLHLICQIFQFFLTNVKSVERNKCVFCFLEIQSLNCLLIVAWGLFSSFKRSTFIDFGKLKMFLHQSTGHHCFSAQYRTIMSEAKILIDPKH